MSHNNTQKNIKENYEFENSILEKIYPLFESATIWKKDGTQEQIVNILRATIQEATLQERERIKKLIEALSETTCCDQNKECEHEYIISWLDISKEDLLSQLEKE